MSTKQRGGAKAQKTKGQRLQDMARKRDERTIRRAHKKEQQAESYLADDENFANFSVYLGKLGLMLRDIPGDGNCLFRALGDQLEGHGRNHFKHRQEVVQYMLDHRADFEPFVEDDVPFDRHVANLKQIGTYAGNDAIVAFAKLHSVNVIIHQLNSPVLSIKGSDKAGARELHISYHNGDHYSSIRWMGDKSESPASIRLGNQGAQPDPSYMKNGKVKAFGNHSNQTSHNNHYPYGSLQTYDNPDKYSSFTTYNGYDSDYDNVPEVSNLSTSSRLNGEASDGVARAVRSNTDVEDYVMSQTQCMDLTLVRQTLKDNFYDVDASIDFILNITLASHNANSHLYDDTSSQSSHYTADSGIWSDNGTASRIFGGPFTNGSSTHSKYDSLHARGAKPKEKQLTGREKKEVKKYEKKKRAEERHKERFLANRLPANALPPDHDAHVIQNGISMLSI